MRTRTVHVVDEHTAATLLRAKNGQTWRKLATDLGFEERNAGTLYGVAQRRPGVITLQGENILRARLGLAPIPAPLTVPPCPDCGNVHTGRCHGRPVAAVVCLAPDETVRPVAKPRSPRKPAHRPYITDEAKWQAYLKWSQEYDQEGER